jgi:hypothetical protein
MFSRYVSTESTITSPSSDIGTPYIQFFKLESQISKKTHFLHRGTKNDVLFH